MCEICDLFNENFEACEPYSQTTIKCLKCGEVFEIFGPEDNDDE